MHRTKSLRAFTFGSGRVVLTGPHPEIEEDSDRDCVTIDQEGEMDDQGSDWTLAQYLFNWIMSAPIPLVPNCFPGTATDINSRVLFSPGP